MPELRTERLRLRQWREGDLEPFALMNADPEVMRHFPAVLSRDESDAIVDRVRAMFAAEGFGLWAVEVDGGAPFIGFVGLSRPRFEAHFTPAVEIGWRLARAHWGQGYATEAAAAALAFGFERVGLDEIVSMAVVANGRSTGVMRRIGMQHDPADDFDHPGLSGSPLERHVLYRLQRARWQARVQGAGA